jgi:perosamine synthetase
MKYIPFHSPYIPESTFDAIKKVLKSGWITAGPKVREFEEMFGEVINSKNNIAVSSCTAALHLSYLANKLGPGDEVIVPSFTFCSTINAIVHVGATPVFCDIDKDTLCADPIDIESKITQKTKAIVVVHYGGMPADMDKINALAAKNKLFVIEDAAHAFMAKYKGAYIGSGKNITCFSFYATKNLTTTEGGMIATQDNNIAEYLRIMRANGISKNSWNRYSKEGTWMYDVIMPGYKYNMTDLEAVIGIEQLKKINVSVKKRQCLVKQYNKLLKNNVNVTLPIDAPYIQSEHAWHLYTLIINNSSRISRDALIKKLKDAGIGTSVHFIPNHLQTYYKQRFGSIDLPVTEQVSKSIISLPLYQSLTDKQVKYICKTINNLV